MKRLFLILFAALSYAVYSQNDTNENFDEIERYLCDYKNFDFEVLKSTNFNNGELKVGKGFFDAHKTYSRNIDYGITDDCYAVMFFNQSNSFPVKDYYIHILSYRESIIGVVYDIGMVYNDYSSKPKSCYDKEQIDEFIAWHNEYYDTESTVDDLIEGIADTRYYSYHCGYSGQGTNVPEYQGEEFTEADIDVFRSWIASYSIEVQNYGYDALNHLRKKVGVKLSKTDKKILRHIKRRNSVINFCYGCTAGIYEKRF